MAEYGKVYAEGFDPSQLVGRKKYAANPELEALGRIAAQQNRYNPVQMMQQAGKQSLTNIPYSAFNPTIGEAVTAGANMLPFIGDAAALSEAKQQLGQGNIGSAVFNAATALPVIGDIASVAKVALPTAAGIGGIIRQMSKRSGDVPTTPFGKQAGILGGVKAKNADLGALNKAQKMTEQGIPREQIWADTGWFKGVDNKWKFEIDDSKSNYAGYLIQGSEADGNIGDLVKHEELYGNYPDLQDIEASYGKIRGGRLSENLFGDKKIDFSGDFDRGVGHHELQHAVQDKEGFARGGSSDEFFYDLEKRKHNANYVIDSANEQMHRNVQIRDRLIAEGAPKERLIPYEEEYQDLIKMKMEVIDDAQIDLLLDPNEKYRALAGETESRAVQSRINLTPQQRIDKPFWLDYDVPESDQIVKFR